MLKRLDASLMDMPEVDYDSQNELLFKLSGQMVARVRSYLSDEDDVENVLLVHGKDLARFIFEQMKAHYWETPTDYRATVARGFQLLRPQAFNAPNDRAVRPFRQPVVEMSRCLLKFSKRSLRIEIYAASAI